MKKGCATGAAFGLYGQRLLDRALSQVSNFPVVYSPALLPALVSLAVVSAAAVAILSIPGTSRRGCHRRWCCRTDAGPASSPPRSVYRVGRRAPDGS